MNNQEVFLNLLGVIFFLYIHFIMYKFKKERQAKKEKLLLKPSHHYIQIVDVRSEDMNIHCKHRLRIGVALNS